MALSCRRLAMTKVLPTPRRLVTCIRTARRLALGWCLSLLPYRLLPLSGLISSALAPFNASSSITLNRPSLSAHLDRPSQIAALARSKGLATRAKQKPATPPERRMRNDWRTREGKLRLRLRVPPSQSSEYSSSPPASSLLTVGIRSSSVMPSQANPTFRAPSRPTSKMVKKTPKHTASLLRLNPHKLHPRRAHCLPCCTLPAAVVSACPREPDRMLLWNTASRMRPHQPVKAVPAP